LKVHRFRVLGNEVLRGIREKGKNGLLMSLMIRTLRQLSLAVYNKIKVEKREEAWIMHVEERQLHTFRRESLREDIA
jgi:hypothetical protein